jgi:NDP-mannose synthase
MGSDRVQVVLMAGGKGTRLRPFTSILPKPLVPIGDLSIVELILKQLKYYGFKEVIMSVGYKAEIIMAVLGNGSKYGLKIRYHIEEKPLGTVGVLPQIRGLDDNFIVMNGDICTNLNFMRIYINHLKCGYKATIGSYVREEKLELGVLEVDNSNKKIVGFSEKPINKFIISMGINVFNKSIIDLIPNGKFFGFDDLMYKMIKENVDIKHFLFDGLWYDIGRPDDYERMLKSFKNNLEAYLPKGLDF